MREVVENKTDISQQEARELVERCLKVLYYRDARSYNRVSLTQEGFWTSDLPQTSQQDGIRVDDLVWPLLARTL